MALGSLALDREDLPTARARNEEALESYHALADRRGIALALNQLAKVAYAAGTYAEAAELCADSLVSAETLGIRRVAVSCLEVLAAIAHQTGQHEVSAQLFGAAAAFRQATGTVAPPTERRLYDRLVGALRDQLGAATYVTAWTAGESLLEEQANALALQVAATVRDSATI
jgi:hypothetical protein